MNSTVKLYIDMTITFITILLLIILSIVYVPKYSLINIFNVNIISIIYFISIIVFIVLIIYVLKRSINTLFVEFQKKEYDTFTIITLLPKFFFIVFIVTGFIIFPTTVDGDSMKPTLSNGDTLIINQLTNNYKNKDIVIIEVDESYRNVDTKELYVKRIIGLPGDKIEYSSGKLYINDVFVEENYTQGTIITFNLDSICNNCNSIVPAGKYFVLGDNRNISKDSRDIGLINEEDIIGKVIGYGE